MVDKLRRVRIGFLALDVKPGEWRHLTQAEVARFRRILKLEPDEEWIRRRFCRSIKR